MHDVCRIKCPKDVTDIATNIDFVDSLVGDLLSQVSGDKESYKLVTKYTLFN